MGAYRSVNFKEPRVFLTVLTILTVIIFLFYFIASMITSVGYQTFAEAENNAETEKKADTYTIILDAGHGGEDPGAVANGLNEKELNLAIVQKLSAFLELSGYRVVLTRTEDVMLYNSGEENRKKYYDLYNRLQIAESYPNAVFISIHMNKFPLENCKGLQTFYSVNNDASEILAESLQQSSKLVMPENNRTIKSDNSTIFLLKELEIPAALVECGFLSNYEESVRLSDPDYQDQLAFSLYCGIMSFMKEYEVENQLCMQ